VISTSKRTVTLNVSATNEYGDPKESMFPYPFLGTLTSSFDTVCSSMWSCCRLVADSLLAEPYKTSTFTISNADVGCSYAWEIAGVLLLCLASLIHVYDEM
jgi:hypothetical protein